MNGLDTAARPRRVVELEWLEDGSSIRIPLRVAGAIEGEHRDLVDSDVIRMRVAAVIVAVGHDHSGLLASDDLDKVTDLGIEIRAVKAVGMRVGLGVGHPGVAVAEHDDLVESDDLRRASQFERAQLCQQLARLGLAEPMERLTRLSERRVLKITLLATGAADQDGSNPS